MLAHVAHDDGGGEGGRHGRACVLVGVAGAGLGDGVGLDPVEQALGRVVV